MSYLYQDHVEPLCVLSAATAVTEDTAGLNGLFQMAQRLPKFCATEVKFMIGRLNFLSSF
jgi:hypothetical protein